MPDNVICKVYKLSKAGKVYMREQKIDFDSFMAMMLIGAALEVDHRKILYEYEFYSDDPACTGKFIYFEGSFTTSERISFVL